jgi:hypothetical protein
MYLHTLGKTIYIYFILYNLMFCLKQNTLLTDFVCLYNYEFGLSLCKIVRSSVILLLPLSIEPPKWKYFLELEEFDSSYMKHAFNFLIIDFNIIYFQLQKWGNPEKTIDLSQVRDKLYHIMSYRVYIAWAGFELTALVVIGTDINQSKFDTAIWHLAAM